MSLSFHLPLPLYFRFRHVAHVYSCGVIVTCSVGDDAVDDDDDYVDDDDDDNDDDDDDDDIDDDDDDDDVE